MKILIKQLLILSIYLVQFNKIKSEETFWKDSETGAFYDWSILKRNSDNPYIIKDEENDDEKFRINYYFNIGKSLNIKCKNKISSVIEILEYKGKNTDICEILGTDESFNVRMIEPKEPKIGIILEYGNGDICKTSQNEELMGYPRKTRFKIYCSQRNDINFILDLPEGKQGTTKCEMEFKIYSSAGCPIAVSSKIKSSKILLLTLILFGLYFLFGFYYNKYKYKLEGKAAIPNYIFWRQFPFLVLEGIFLIKDYISKFFNNKSKNK